MTLSWRVRDASKAPPLLRLRSSKWFILATVSIAVFTDIFLYGLIVPVIPFALSSRAGVREADVQHWISVLLAVYGAALLIASPLCGWLADKSSNRRLPLLVGLLMLGGATVMLCVGSSLAVLITGRVLQGMSAANVWSVGLALLVDTVGQTEIGQIMGTVFLAMSLGFLISPLLGGIVYANAGYYPVFYMAFGAIVLDILLRLLLIEKKVAKKWLDEPVAPGLSDTLPVALQLPTADPAMVLDKHSEHANIVPATDASPFRLPPVITLLSSRRLLSALWCCLVQATITTAFDSVLPLYVQSTFGWSSTGAGLMFLPLIIPSLVAPVIGSVADKYGSRYLAFCGFLGTAPILVLLRLVTFNSIGQKVLLAALLALIGFALSCAFVPTMTEVTYVVEARERKTPGIFGKQGAYAQAYSLFNVFFASGTLIGPIWGGFVVSGAGWGTMSLTLGILSAVTAIPALIWTGGFIRDPGRSKDRNSGSGEGPGDIELRSPPAQSGSLTAVEPATEESVDFISHA